MTKSEFSESLHPLAPFEGRRPDAPEWFNRAIAVPYDEHRIAVEGATIEALSWGDSAHPPLLLLHGSMAHARWWIPVAPLLASDYRVVAMSFSGMGGSDWRDHYSTSLMAREALAVVRTFKMLDGPRRPVLIAHSFGGLPAADLASDHGLLFSGTIFVDSMIFPRWEADGRVPRYRARFYDSEVEALSRFRLSPDQPDGELFILDTIARASLVVSDNRWTWRFDPDFFSKLQSQGSWENALKATCQLAFIRGELSPVATRKHFALQRQNMRSDCLFVEIPQAHHHIMVDQPLALTTALRAILSAWGSLRRR